MYKDKSITATIKRTTMDRLREISKKYGTGYESVDIILNELMDHFVKGVEE